MPDTDTARPPEGVKKKRRWLWSACRAVLVTLTLVVASIVGVYVFFASEMGLAFAVRLLVARSDGQLQVEGASGSLFSTVRVKRLAWNGHATKVSADEVA